MRFQVNSLDMEDIYIKAATQSGYVYKCEKVLARGKEEEKRTLIHPEKKEVYEIEFEIRDGQRLISAHLCPHCGVEFYAQWDCKKISKYSTNISFLNDIIPQLVKEDIYRFRELKECPYCGETLSKEKGFFIEHSAGHTGPIGYILRIDNLVNNDSKGRYTETDFGMTEKSYLKEIFGLENLTELDYIFHVMSNQRFIKQIAEKNIPNCENNVVCVSLDVPNIKENVSTLKDYIHNLIKIEMNLISLKTRLSTLYKLQTDMETKEQYIQKQQELIYFFEKIQDEENKYKTCLQTVKEYKDKPLCLIEPKKPEKPLMKQAGIFNKKKIMEENEALQKQYEIAMKDYEEKVQANEQFIVENEHMIAEELAKAEESKLQIENLKDNIKKQVSTITVSSYSFKKEMIDKEIIEAEELFKQVYDCREKLYSYNIVYHKYRNDVVALSSFYEYLMSGRCETLEGAHGAYNIYEAEIRANAIVAHLDEIRKQLNTLIQTQFMICSELQKVNKNMSELNSKMDSALASVRKIEKGVENISLNTETIARNTEVIAYNSQVTAYYSKLNTELTNALGYMVALK